MAEVMGVDTRTLFTLVFAIGAALSAVAGALLGPLLAVQVGMGENILILAFVVISIGGIGSIRGALIGSLLVGLLDTAGRAFLPFLFRTMFPSVIAAEAGPAVASMLVYVLMAAVLYFRPSGLFPARG
jgi:branched-chain amino acid transport system permease protein